MTSSQGEAAAIPTVTLNDQNTIPAIGLGVGTLSEDEDEERSKKPIVVITPRGVVIRDGSGLRHWQFEDLASVSTRWHMDRLLLVLVGQDGKRALVDCQRFRRGHRLPEIISRRVKPGAAQTAQA